MGSMANIKICPFAAAHPRQENSDCLGETCACYAIMHRRAFKPVDETGSIYQEVVYRYAGCNLVTKIPWKIVTPENNPKTST